MNYSLINHVKTKACLLLLPLCYLAGCATLPAADPAPRLAKPQSSDFVLHGNAAWPQADWWQRYQDPQLDTLMRFSLRGAPSMALALARVEQATAASAEVAAAAGANLSATAQATRQLYSQNSVTPPPMAGNYATNGLLQLDFRYDFDFWGRNRQALQAALGRQAAAAADGAAAATLLTASVANLYFQWQANQQRLALNEQVLQARRTLLQLTSTRVQAGISAGDDLQPLQVDVATPEQLRVQLQTRDGQLRNQLQALIGLEQPLPSLQPHALPAVDGALPGALSLDLLARRPDIIAARERVRAALSDVESARAAFYPDFSLSAFIGLNSLQMGNLLHAGSRQQGISPALHLPLFDAGRLRASLDSQRAEATLATAQYEQAVVNAVQEVNDAMLRLQGHHAEGPALQRQRQARLHALANSQARLAAGLADKREVTRNQLSLLTQTQQEIDQQEQVLDAQIDLMKSLGGGYGQPSREQEHKHD